MLTCKLDSIYDIKLYQFKNLFSLSHARHDGILKRPFALKVLNLRQPKENARVLRCRGFWVRRWSRVVINH